MFPNRLVSAVAANLPLTPARQDRALFAAVVAAWFAASLHFLSGRRHIPWDSTAYYFPQTAFVVAALRRGELPWWNPYAFAGAPVLGDPQGMIFTPHTLVGWLAGPAFGLSIFDATTLATVLVGGLCLMAFARAHGATPVLAALGAIVFMLGGYASSRLQHVTQIISYAWLPVLLLAFRGVVHRPGPRSSVLLGLAGLLFLLNPNQLVFLAPLLLAPVLLVELSAARRPAAVALGFLAAITIALLGAAPSLSAILEVVAHSVRNRLTLADNAAASLSGMTLLSVVLPGLFGTLPRSRDRWPPGDLTETHLYVGVIPTLALLAGLARRTRPPAVLVAAWVGMVLSFLFALGVRGPVFPFLFVHVPGFDLFRRPSDGAYFFNLFVAMGVALAAAPGTGRMRPWWSRLVLPSVAALAVISQWPTLSDHATRLGMQASLDRSVHAFAFRLAVFLLVAIMVVTLVRKPWRGALLGMAALALTTLDFVAAGRVSAFSGADRSSAEAALLRRPASAETLPTPLARDLAELRGGAVGRTEIHGGELARMAPIAFGIPLAQGYNPLRLARYAEVFGGQNLGDEPKRFTASAPDYRAPAYRWLGLDRVLLHEFLLNEPSVPAIWHAGLNQIARDLRLAGARETSTGGAYRSFTLPWAFPRASLAPAYGGEDDAPIGRCEVLRETTTSLAYRCSPEVPARLVVPDSFAPGWMTCVNGARVEIEPFLGALRAVRLGPEPSVITLDYRPVPWLRRFFRCPTGVS